MNCVAVLLSLILGLGSSAGCGGPETAAPPTPLARSGDGILAGRTIVLDPGHQLGNHNFPSEINKQVPAGGFTKPCNTTGTATDGGYAEATFAWKVALRLKKRLEGLGARVVLTRNSNSEKHWGPCVDRRGRAGNKIPADLKISIHGDGSYASGAHGFHVIAPTDRAPWTDDIYDASSRLALVTRAALVKKDFVYATYIAGGDGLDYREDLGTLNLSDIPTVMVELGNMRDSGDAKVMTSAKGQGRYAAALARAVRLFLR
jgi:N-acetylmuramoyl-L-alanine amidase